MYSQRHPEIKNYGQEIKCSHQFIDWINTQVSSGKHQINTVITKILRNSGCYVTDISEDIGVQFIIFSNKDYVLVRHEAMNGIREGLYQMSHFTSQYIPYNFERMNTHMLSAERAGSINEDELIRKYNNRLNLLIRI